MVQRAHRPFMCYVRYYVKQKKTDFRAKDEDPIVICDFFSYFILASSYQTLRELLAKKIMEQIPFA